MSSIFQFFRSFQKQNVVRRSSLTIIEALSAAREAGRKTPDTGLFSEWVKSKGLSSRGAILMERMRQEYEAGFEERFQSPSPRELNAAFLRRVKEPATFKGYQLWEDAAGWHYSGEKESVFDSLRDVKSFINSLEVR